MSKINRLDEARKLYNRLSMDVRRIIRMIRYKFGPEEVVYDNWALSDDTVKAIMEKDYMLTICSYDEERGVYIVLISSLNSMEC